MRSVPYWLYSARARRKTPEIFTKPPTPLDKELDSREHDVGDLVCLLAQRARSYWTPEHSLLRALLEEAQLCLSREHACEAKRNTLYCTQCDVLAWLAASPDIKTQKNLLTNSFTFVYICETLDLDKERTRKAILQWHGGRKFLYHSGSRAQIKPQVKVRL